HMRASRGGATEDAPSVDFSRLVPIREAGSAERLVDLTTGWDGQRDVDRSGLLAHHATDERDLLAGEASTSEAAGVVARHLVLGFVDVDAADADRFGHARGERHPRAVAPRENH